jgi:uncharacterized RDD family membrane protein YckC
LSKCLKCGAELPPVGECTACSDTVSPQASKPSLLNKDIRIDRRTPERTPAVPSFAELAPHGPPAPPRMTPRQAAPPPVAPPPAPAFEAPRSITPPAFPRMAVAPPPAPAAPAPTAMASAAQLPPPPPPPLAQHAAAVAQASPPAPGGLPRQVPTPVPVVTFTPPARMPPPPSSELGPEPQTPRMPTASLPSPASAGEASAARPRTAANVRNASLGEQELHARPASLWRRLLSFTIDSATIIGVSALYITLASSITGLKAPSSQGLTALDTVAAWINALKSVLVPGALLVLVLATVYCAVAAFLWNGRTLGRMVLGLRLVDTHGLAPAPARAVLRALLSVVSFGLFLGGFWMALFDRRGQTLHDKLTSTFVVQPS